MIKEYQPVKNYIELRCRRPFSRNFMFVDTSDHIFRRVMKRSKVRLRAVKEFIKDESPFRLITCRIKDVDLEMFLKAMEEVRNAALIRGYREYDIMCAILQNAREEGVLKWEV